MTDIAQAEIQRGMDDAATLYVVARCALEECSWDDTENFVRALRNCSALKDDLRLFFEFWGPDKPVLH